MKKLKLSRQIQLNHTLPLLTTAKTTKHFYITHYKLPTPYSRNVAANSSNRPAMECDGG